MTALSQRVSAWIVGHAWMAWCVIAIITVVAVIGYINPRLITQWFESPEPQVSSTEAEDASGDAAPTQRPPDVNPISLTNADAVMVLQSDSFFTPRGSAMLKSVVESLENLDQVSSILWLDRMPVLNIFGLPEPLLPSPKASQLLFDQAKEEAMQHPLVAGQVLSRDGRTLLLLINYNYYFIFDDADATAAIKQAAVETAAKFKDIQVDISLTGRVPTSLAAIESHEANQLKYQLIGYGMIVVMTLILFRGIRAVIIVSLAPAMGVFWTLGLLPYLDLGRNPLVDVILPILVSLVGLTDGVHLMVQIRKLRASGNSPKDAARIGLEQVGLACFLTSLTTAIGFGSLMLADSEWVREFGQACMLGVLLCFLAVVLMIPLACLSWLGRNVHVGHERSLIEQHLSRIESLIGSVLTYPKTMACIGILGTLALGGLALTLKPDHRESDGLPQDAEATQAFQHMDRAMGGLQFGEVAISWDAETPSDDPEVLEVVSRVDELLDAEPLIGSPLSIRNLIDAQPGSGPLAERMSMLDLLPPPLKRAFYTPESRFAKVTFRVQDLGIARYGPVFERIEAGLANIVADHSNFRLQLRGSPVWRWKNLYQIVVDLAASLGTASIIILIVLTLVYRSIRLGLISIVPNMFPLAVTGAYLVLAGYNLEIVMVCNFTICLGIAVDDTIHFLTRFREEQQRTGDDRVAICRAFTGVGTALIMTTAVLVAGFSVVTFSDSRDHQIFATMGALTISAALFCDLVFLPPLLDQFASKRQSKLKAGLLTGDEAGTDENRLLSTTPTEVSARDTALSAQQPPSR